MDAQPINVIIPMGGLGSRFRKEGYLLPKPLINIIGKPMISWLLGNLNFQPRDNLYIVLQRELNEDYRVAKLLREEFPDINIHFTDLNGLTRGAAETLFMCTKGMSAEELSRPTLSLDCDTLYFSDVLRSFRSLEYGQGCCCYFIDEGDDPIFSYIQVDPDTSSISDIVEKVAISRNANTGAYGFGNAATLHRYTNTLLRRHVSSAGEFYTSAVIGTMIRDENEFRAIHISDFQCVGTPAQLVEFLAVAKQRGKIPKRTIVLDIDSVPDLKGMESICDTQIIETLTEDSVTILREALDHGVDIRLSMESGFVPEEGESEFKFAPHDLRNISPAKGCFLPIDGHIRKAIGW